jgi:hypothetical protein
VNVKKEKKEMNISRRYLTMLEIRINAPELSEAINNLAAAMIAHAKTPLDGGQNGAVQPNGACVVAEAPAPVEEPKVVPAPAVPTVQAPVTPVAPTEPVAQPIVPTAAPQYTLEMIARAGTALVDAGKTAEVSALLAKYGADVLTALDPSLYGAIAADLRAMGAQI